jgi:hypothetical protein
MHERFLPLLRERGFDEEILERLTVINPFRASAPSSSRCRPPTKYQMIRSEVSMMGSIVRAERP